MNWKRSLPFRHRLKSVREWIQIRHRRRAFRAANLPPLGDVRVFYGHEHIPNPAEQAHGGIVKFQRMQAIYPNSPGCFNILYMVSSSPPAGATHIARLARRKGMKLVWNQNGVAYPATQSDWKARNVPMAKLLHAAAHVFYQSDFCRRAANRFLGERNGPAEILYNSVDTSFFTPNRSPIDSKDLTLMLGGTQYQYYRLETAVHTLARVRSIYPKARLLVTGRLSWCADEEEAKRTVYHLAEQLGVAEGVSLLGAYTQQNAPAVFRQAHILLHTKYNDPCPGMVVEAMACGLPVVYSSSGGVPELVGPDAGIGIPAELSWERDIPPDPDALSQAVLKVAEHQRKFAEAARQRAVEKLDLKPWIQRHQTVFEELVS